MHPRETPDEQNRHFTGCLMKREIEVDHASAERDSLEILNMDTTWEDVLVEA